MFWLLLVLITLIVVAAHLLVLFWPRATAQDTSDYDIQVYRSQLREVEQAAGTNQLSDSEAAAARAEISRRILAADRRRSSTVADARPMRDAAVGPGRDRAARGREAE